MKEKLIKNDPYNNQEIFEALRPINNFAASYNIIKSKVVYPTLQERYPEYKNHKLIKN